MTNLDFSTKEFVTSYCYSTAKYDRLTTRSVKYLGRTYTAYGTNQVVTAIGNVYSVKEKNSNKHVNVMFVGISRQSPYERRVDKQMGEEQAAINSLTNPQIVMILPEYYGNRAFYHMMNDYVYNMRLEMMKTAGEIQALRDKKSQDNEENEKSNAFEDMIEMINTTNAAEEFTKIIKTIKGNKK